MFIFTRALVATFGLQLATQKKKLGIIWVGYSSLPFEHWTCQVLGLLNIVVFVAIRIPQHLHTQANAQDIQPPTNRKRRFLYVPLRRAVLPPQAHGELQLHQPSYLLCTFFACMTVGPLPGDTHQVKTRILRLQLCIEHQHWANAQLMHLHTRG